LALLASYGLRYNDTMIYMDNDIPYHEIPNKASTSVTKYNSKNVELMKAHRADEKSAIIPHSALTSWPAILPLARYKKHRNPRRFTMINKTLNLPFD
jgi:hypothetical protein